MASLPLSEARAEEASATETAAARALAVEGLKLAQANNCAEAVSRLERAEKLYHSAIVAGRLGECFVSLGRLVEGTEILRKVLREPPPADVTPAHGKALERAQRTLEAATPRIAGLTIKVASVQDMRVKLDGQLVANALLESEVPMDPGEHEIEVGAPSFLTSATRVGLREGEKKSVTVTLTRDPNAVAAAVPDVRSNTAGSAAPAADVGAGPATSEASAAPTRREPSHAAAYVALGLGAAGVAAGGVLGYLTMSRSKDLGDRCPGEVCPAGTQADIDAAKRLGNFSTVAFGVGGAGLVLGTVLLFTGGSSSSDRAKSKATPRFAGLSAPRVAVGPGQVQLSADF